MKLLKFALLFFVSTIYSQTNYQKVRVYYNSKAELYDIIQKGEIDHFNHKEGVYIETNVPENKAQSIKKSGYTVNVIQNDLQSYYEKSLKEEEKNATPSCSASINPVNYNTGSMGGYLTYNEMLAELDEMKKLYPNLITTKAPIGDFLTFENRTIQFVKISDNPEKDETERRALYTSVHHAREPGSMQQLIYFMWYLLENYATNSEIKGLIDNTEIFFVPIVNPDGYIHNQKTNPNGGGLWRKNRRKHSDGNYGVDNNRNYSYKWGTTGVSTTDTSDDTYCGSAPVSEPENKAIQWFCEQKKFGVAINNHSYSQLILLPFGYAANTPTPAPDNTIYQLISNEMVKYSGYKNQLSSALYPASGVSDDWMYGDISTKPKIYAFAPEIGTDFWDSPAKTKINNNNMLHTNMTILRFLHNTAIFTDKKDSFITAQPNYNFDYSLKRIGLVNNEDFTVKLIPVSSNIISVSSPNTHANIGFNAEISGKFEIKLGTGILEADPVIFDVEINNGTYTHKERITKYYGTTTVKFDEPGNNINQWTTNGWDISAKTFNSANASITDSPSGNYANNQVKSIQTKSQIGLSNASRAELTFYAKWDIENNYDYVQLEISKDNGTTWIAQCGKNTILGKDSQDPDKPLYGGKQETWVKEQIDLSDYLDQKILIRFRLKTDGQNVKDGFYFDDLKVVTIQKQTLGITENNIESLNIVPNPVSNYLTLSTIEGLNNYKIYDASGKIISSGKVLKTIDVSYCPEGVYILEVSNGSQKKRIRFVKKQ
jgi:carboxypeptidase T